MIPYALGAIFVLFLVLAYIVIQGTRAALAWRTAASEGDVKVIRDIVEDALNGWRSMKRPKPVAVEVWRGIQSMQLVEVGPEYVHISCQAESEYKLADGRWIEVRNPLQDGIAVAARAADMAYYDLPHFRPRYLQLDVYSTTREESGVTRRDCILTLLADREEARHIDWEEATPEQIVEALGGVYHLSDTGRPLPIDPIVPPADLLPAPEEPSTEAAEAHP